MYCNDVKETSSNGNDFRNYLVKKWNTHTLQLSNVKYKPSFLIEKINESQPGEHLLLHLKATKIQRAYQSRNLK